MLPTLLSTLSAALGAALLTLSGAEEPTRPLPAAQLISEIGYVHALSTSDTATDSASAPLAGEAGQLDRLAPGTLVEPGGPSLEDAGDFGVAADMASLDSMRGGDGNANSSIVMNGNVADNRATNVVTGTNMITDGSFANASGVPMVVQNTGANVLIQNATVINLQLR